MSRHLLPLLLASTLTACASGVPQTAASLTLPDPPAQDMQPCPDLPDPASGKAGDLLANHVATAKAYQECKARQAALAEHARKIKQVLDDRSVRQSPGA